MRSILERRLVAVRPSLWPIAQTAVAAGVSWELARHVADHPRPIFAPIVAIVAMGITAGRRARAALFMVLGVALGILLADVLTRGIGHGGWQIVVVVAVAMTVAVAIRSEPLFVSQAAVSGMLVVVLPAASSGRLVDCAIGGAVAFVASALLFPLDTERVLLRETERVSGGIAASLEESAVALERTDPERAWRGRHRVVSAAALDEALVVAHGAVRVAPRRFASRGRVEAYERAISHLAAASRATRVVGGAVARLLRCACSRRLPATHRPRSPARRMPPTASTPARPRRPTPPVALPRPLEMWPERLSSISSRRSPTGSPPRPHKAPRAPREIVTVTSCGSATILRWRTTRSSRPGSAPSWAAARRSRSSRCSAGSPSSSAATWRSPRAVREVRSCASTRRRATG
jgi:hypothetical protein